MPSTAPSAAAAWSLLGLDQVLQQAPQLALGLGEFAKRVRRYSRSSARGSRRSPPMPPSPRGSGSSGDEILLLLEQLLQCLRDIAAWRRSPCQYSVLRTSKRCWTTGRVASSLATAAPIVARSASFCSCWRSSTQAWPELAILAGQEAALCLDLRRAGAVRRTELGQRIAILDQHRPQPR